MLNSSYSNTDLEQLTEKARTLWEYDFQSTPKKIKRRQNVIADKIPLQAIYRMVVEDWHSSQFNRYDFPFSNSSFARVIGLKVGWDIPVGDRKFIEKDMILFDSDGRTILILPEAKRNWWESTWFNLSSWIFGLFGLLFGIFAN